VCDGGLAACDDSHLGASDRMAADGRFDFAGCLRFADYDREILAPYRMRLQLAHEAGLRHKRFRDDQQSARILV
jgi:hypothetical protein